MIDRAETLMDEVRQLRTQYVNEVGSGRRVWPRSIKARILELEQVGIPPKIIAAKTGVPVCVGNSHAESEQSSICLYGFRWAALQPGSFQTKTFSQSAKGSGYRSENIVPCFAAYLCQSLHDEWRECL